MSVCVWVCVSVCVCVCVCVCACVSVRFVLGCLEFSFPEFSFRSAAPTSASETQTRVTKSGGLLQKGPVAL